METLNPVLTNAGLRALLNASNTGVEAAIAEIAFGDANGAGYAPQANRTALVRERARVAVGGGERVANSEVEVQALLDTGPSFWIREVGFVLDDGTMLAIWSDPDTPLAYKTAGVPLAVAYNLALEGAPADTVTVNITGPNVNLTLVGPIALLSAEIVRAHRLAISAERVRATPLLENMWR